MLVDFYQLSGAPLEDVVASIAAKLMAQDGRLLLVASDEALLGKLDRLLWDQGPASFLPHGIAGGPDDARQPILLSATTDAPNRGGLEREREAERMPAAEACMDAGRGAATRVPWAIESAAACTRAARVAGTMCASRGFGS